MVTRSELLLGKKNLKPILLEIKKNESNFIKPNEKRTVLRILNKKFGNYSNKIFWGLLLTSVLLTGQNLKDSGFNNWFLANKPLNKFLPSQQEWNTYQETIQPKNSYGVAVEGLTTNFTLINKENYINWLYKKADDALNLPKNPWPKFDWDTEPTVWPKEKWEKHEKNKKDFDEQHKIKKANNFNRTINIKSYLDYL